MSHLSPVSAPRSLAQWEAPRWLIIAAAIAGAALLVYFGWQALLGREGEPGPRKMVYPGMYDLRAEVARMRASRQGGSVENGH